MLLILRTIIKIVGSISDGLLTVKRALQQASWNATALEARQCRIICLLGRLSFLPWASLALTFFLQACTTELAAVPKEGTVQSNVAVGRVIAVLTGERSRKYEPAVKSFGVRNRVTNERFWMRWDLIVSGSFWHCHRGTMN